MIRERAHKSVACAWRLFLELICVKPSQGKRGLSDQCIDHEIPVPNAPSRSTVADPSEERYDVAWRVDFSQPELYAQTRPVNCAIKGRAVVPDKQVWSRLLVAITEHLIDGHYPNIMDLGDNPIYGSNMFFMTKKANYGTSAQLSNGKWIYTNYNSQTIIAIIGKLCRHCGVALEDVSINCVPKHAPRIDLAVDGKGWPLPQPVNPDLVEPDVMATVTNVLVTHFSNGFRLDSPIEIMRFRSFSDARSVDIQLDDEGLKRAIISCGTLFEGKVYVVKKETENRIKHEIEVAVEHGAEILYYAAIFQRHENWLVAGSIIGESMLKGLLKRLFPSYQHKGNYFSTRGNDRTELAIIGNEILRTWRQDTLLSYEQISERLPYIPLDKIKYVLAQNQGFIWNSTGVYTHIGRVDLIVKEQAEIENCVDKACRMFGYASMCDLPLGEFQERNYELSTTAIHNAVFAILLSDKYDKRSKIITRKGDSLDALAIMKEYCRTVDRCTLQDLMDFERELTGEAHQWISLEAGCSVLIRTSHDTFVAERYVRFSTNKIDDAINLFVTGDYLPLKGVTTFAAFPDCGQAWSLYMLESFTRRFSNRFRFEALSFNSRNAGAIVRKSSRRSYAQILADAVATSGVELTKSDVVDFLCANGFIGKRSYAKASELIDMAKAIREGRG